MPKSLSSSMLKKAKENQLKQKAEENARVEVTNSVEGTSNVVKPGVPNDHFNKHKSDTSIGMSIGCTKNMGDYESLRVDVWLSDTLKPDETVQEGYERIETLLNEVLESTVLSIVGE